MQQELFISQASVIPNLLPQDGVVEVHPQFFTQPECDILLPVLINETDWQQDRMKFYGREVDLPRLTAWYGEAMDNYSYSGINMNAKPWTPELLFIKRRVEKSAGMKFTSVLLNYYRNGNDSVSWHRDNEKVLRANPVIASVSFGATRTFKFRHVDNHRMVKSIELENGMYILMKGETQHKWEHTIPKSAKVTGPRVSLTFRILF
jgi:alkylated DNA repair dioxygenase AlkB